MIVTLDIKSELSWALKTVRSAAIRSEYVSQFFPSGTRSDFISIMQEAASTVDGIISAPEKMQLNIDFNTDSFILSENALIAACRAYALDFVIRSAIGRPADQFFHDASFDVQEDMFKIHKDTRFKRKIRQPAPNVKGATALLNFLNAAKGSLATIHPATLMEENTMVRILSTARSHTFSPK